MNKIKLKTKAIVLSLVLAALLPATTVSAQGILGSSLVDEYYEEQDRSSEGMLRKGSGSISYGDPEGQSLTLGGITHDNFGETPLGGGIAILVLAGAGYAIFKKKEDKA